jgi:hypothetical protein
MFFEQVEVITCLYGIKIKTDIKRDKKIKVIIAEMGDKYLLAKPVEKKHG